MTGARQGRLPKCALRGYGARQERRGGHDLPPRSPRGSAGPPRGCRPTTTSAALRSRTTPWRVQRPFVTVSSPALVPSRMCLLGATQGRAHRRLRIDGLRGRDRARRGPCERFRVHVADAVGAFACQKLVRDFVEPRVVQAAREHDCRSRQRRRARLDSDGRVTLDCYGRVGNMAPPFGLWQLSAAGAEAHARSPPEEHKESHDVAFLVPSISLAARTLGLLALALTCSVWAELRGKHVGRPLRARHGATRWHQRPDRAVSSPALECPSRICLLPAPEESRSSAQTAAGVSGTGATCTADCEENADCEDGEKGNASNAADKRCRGGFVCGWPTTVGAFACQKLCICTDFISVPTTGLKKPSVCRELTARRSTRVNSFRRRSGCRTMSGCRPSSQNVTATTSKRNPSAAGVSASR